MDIKVQKGGEGVPDIELGGGISIEHAAQLKEALAKALKKKGAVVDVDMVNVTGLDTACLQVFLSARKSARDIKKTLKLCRVPDSVRTMVEHCGYGFGKVVEEEGGRTCFHL